MCGVAGIFAYHYAANAISRPELSAMSRHMARRGPDASGEWFDPSERLGLAHRRLAIIDLADRALQPMASADGRHVIVFNGEIYNHLALREALLKEGAEFRTRSDTEVLLQLYARCGGAMVTRLRGMFAFAIYDTLAHTLFLARDPYGIKPLYYSDDGWVFRFASQVKTLISGGGVSRDRDPAGDVGFYLFGSVPEPFTCFREVRALPAGSTMLVDRAGARVPRGYHRVASVYDTAARDPRKRRDGPAAFADIALDSVRHHLAGDVEVGAFLSAGVDSAALVGLMRDAGARQIKTITIGFEEFADTPADETSAAAQIARFYGTRHVTRMITRSEFEADLPHFFEAMDQPSIDGLNTWFAAKTARELGLKAVLSGLGGDELLGGYPSFRDIPRWVRTLQLPSRIPLLGKGLRRLGKPLSERLRLHPKLAGLPEYGGSYAGAYLLKRGLYLPWELGEVLDRDTIEAGLRRLQPLKLIKAQLHGRPREPFARIATLESSLYLRNQLLRDADWAGMAHSVEIRTPLVDSEVLERSARLDLRGIAGKTALARSPAQPLPQAVLDRPKTGFALPIAEWMPVPSFGSAPAPRKPHRHGWARDWSRLVHRQFA
ncbi:asparagine synthase (glutamine-hydrolyzing) [Labrys okinawensis]|uniref:asparagine synthase (glutamine-hydrolyzing) n=1 Tax=Labrys okinawensis TaxID=346911 RepID=A0A2S9QJY1_9HYPH|nr:asparagine synthase (glutamine-hydrolyzing) [Labrys okinawensis]PRH89669.1 asparagine synthase (glutamine-hydrolyzing) [Labrys okinawensis]